MSGQCLRCGQCCHYEINGIIKKCKFLVTLPNGKTLCRIYRQRLGTLIDYDRGRTIVCVKRKDDDRLFQNCPLNNDNENLNIPAYTNVRYAHNR